ncbi:MAG: C10 family peptidase [Clostridia bacterium]|nr:C10 family peptidase [Clostridia bacterium]
MKKVISLVLTVFVCLSTMIFTLGIIKPDETLLNAIDIARKLFNSNCLKSEVSNDIKRFTAKYIKGLDNNEDFIVVETENGGYVIFEKTSFDLIEYSPIDKSPYVDISSSNSYYAGPSQYYKKDGNQIRHTKLNKVLSENECLTVASSFKEKHQDILKNRTKEKSSSNARTLGSIGDLTGPDNFAFRDRRYISGYEFFIDNTNHGRNLESTCASVATQLLLAYNNWYHDGRIIPQGVISGNKRFLYDEYSSFEESPYSDARLSTTSEYNTADDEVTFYEMLVDKINPDITQGATRDKVKEKIREYLNEYAQSVQADIISTGDIAYNTVYNTLKTEVENSRPIYLSIHYESAGAEKYHAIVGYGYQKIIKNGEEIDGVIAHFGWSEESNVWFEKGWLTGYLTFNVQHSHSDYYLDANSHIKKCSLCSRTTISGEHDFTPYLLDFDVNGRQRIYHNMVCVCGYSFYEKHLFNEFIANEVQGYNKHKAKCYKCNGEYVVDCEVKVSNCRYCGKYID